MPLEISEHAEFPDWLRERLAGGPAPMAVPAPDPIEALVHTRAAQLLAAQSAVSSRDPAAGWATRRTAGMACRRLPGELVSAVFTVHTREAGSLSVGALHTGAKAASSWVLGFTDERPTDSVDIPFPSVDQVVAEYVRAVAAAAGLRPVERVGASDLGRIIAHGVELFLLWYLWTDVPAPALLDGLAPLGSVEYLLGDVRAERPGEPDSRACAGTFPLHHGSRVHVDKLGALVLC
jgi:hypothetical protein